ncbi:Leucine zipper transcription factor-like protein 1 [Labeo rohita]|uniref:Leucine zipper transcription factor-like protein 1 n=1 Tax=Labeo rohita TaxID=84645 RepID=A0ABQ8MN73_LABRO|nr:Leucine zipper transcription factor-like protein 1 [Labeo rohita]
MEIGNGNSACSGSRSQSKLGREQVLVNTVFVGISMNSQLTMASLSPQRVTKLSSVAQSFNLNRRMKLIKFQQLLGMSAAAVIVIPLGLLRAHPQQRWVNGFKLHPKLGRRVRMRVTQRCIQMLRPWKNKRLLSQGVPLGNIPAITTDASLTGLGGVCEGRSVRGLWEPPWTLEHINVLELRAVYLSLRTFLPSLQNKHVLKRMDNMSAVHHINPRVAPDQHVVSR